MNKYDSVKLELINDFTPVKSEIMANREREEVKTLDSVKILDGFKSVMKQFGKYFENIRFEHEEEDKIISEDEKSYSQQYFRKLEELKKAKDNEEARFKREKYEIEQKYKSDIKKINYEYKQSILTLRENTEGQIDEIKKTFKLFEETTEILRDFFNCENGYNKHYEEKAGFPENLKKLLGISGTDADYIYWYKKYKYVYGQTEVEYLGNANSRIGQKVRVELYDQTLDKIKVRNRGGIKEIVKLLLEEVKNANNFDQKRRFRMPTEQQEHIENAVYIYVQLICASEKCKQEKDVAINQLRMGQEETRKKHEANKQEKIEDKKKQYQEKCEEIENKKQEKNSYYVNIENKYREEENSNELSIKERRTKNKEKTQEKRKETVSNLKEALESYFDKCLNGITIGLDAAPFSVKQFVTINSIFNMREDGIPYKTPDDYRTFLCPGSIKFDYAKISEFECQRDLLNGTKDFFLQYFDGISGPLFSIDDTGITIPYVIDFAFFKGICFDYPSDKYDVAKLSCQSLMFHMLTDTKASSIYYTMVDSKEPHGFFSEFNDFRGVDARTEKIFNGNNIFNTEPQISKIMQEQCDSLTTFSASFSFKSIVECNRETKGNKHPINVIFITDSSNDSLLHNAYKNIKTLLSTGTKLGYSCVLMRARGSENSANELSGLNFQGAVLEYLDNYKYRVKGTSYNIDFFALPEKNVIDATGKDVSECFKFSVPDAIDFTQMSKSSSEIEDTYDGISVENCMFNENNKSISYELNDIYLNGLIMGGSGFGKTRFFHAVIAGIMEKYSPDSVQIHFFDYKSASLGTSIYSEIKLPHMGVISNITNRVAGLNFLRTIDKQLKQRNEIIGGARENGENANLDKYSAYIKLRTRQRKMGENVKPFPRIVVFIDEVQELINKGDEISCECIDIIKKILRQGRASGIHLIIATQWLSNISDVLDVKILREGFQNMILFHSQGGYEELGIDKAKMSSITESGEALYKLGENQNVVKVARIEGNDEKKYLEGVESKYLLSYSVCNTILLRNEIRDGVASEFVRFYKGEDLDFSDLPVIIGESVDFKGTFALKPNKGNLIKFLMISQEEESKSSVSATIILCLLAKLQKSHTQKKGCIIFADFANSCEIVRDTICSALPEDNSEILHYYDYDDSINGIRQQLQNLMDTDTDIYLFVNGIAYGMDNREMNDLFTILNNRVNLFIFGDSAKQISDFVTNSRCNLADFGRAIYLGEDTDYKYMLGPQKNLECKFGQVILCKGVDDKNTHEIVPFDYSSVGLQNFDCSNTDLQNSDNSNEITLQEWLRNFIKKLFEQTRSPFNNNIK